MIAGTLLITTAAPAPAAPSPIDDRLFPRPAAIAQRIEFWKRIFTEFREDQAVFHDAEHVHLVYSVVDIPASSPQRGAALRKAETERIRAILHRLHRHGNSAAGLSHAERQIFELFAGDSDPDKFRSAASRVRSQVGLRTRFAQGLGVSHRYLPEMERIFRAAGLPPELTRLPMIESCFDVRAYSHKGAAGIWQFMPTTGRLYGLRVDRLVDERRDPIRATHAAARYLAANHDSLGHWPLAITAYNHGAGGIARGVRTVGSDDIAVLVARYRGRSFGFAGQNFYAEFLAAVEVTREPQRYFPGLEYDRPFPTDEFPLPDAVGLRIAARTAGVSTGELAALNPSLSSRIISGSSYIPRGYRLRLPEGAAAGFQQQAAAWEADRVARLAQASQHRVRHGETLSDIASQYGTTVSALTQDNRISNPRRLRVGQTLKIVRRGDRGPEAVRPATQTARRDGSTVSHRVRRGQTLTDIARDYGTTVPALQRHNGIRNARSLKAGQLLTIPGTTPPTTATVVRASSTSSAPPAVQHVASTSGSTIKSDNSDLSHRVRRGQTLSHIAKEYGTSVGTLQRHNGIRNARSLRAGQVVSIPDKSAEHRVLASIEPGSNYISHRVRRGQTLSHIARQYGTSVGTLKRYNGISDARRLKASQVIKIPNS